MFRIKPRNIYTLIYESVEMITKVRVTVLGETNTRPSYVWRIIYRSDTSIAVLAAAVSTRFSCGATNKGGLVDNTGNTAWDHPYTKTRRHSVNYPSRTSQLRTTGWGCEAGKTVLLRLVIWQPMVVAVIFPCNKMLWFGSIIYSVWDSLVSIASGAGPLSGS